MYLLWLLVCPSPSPVGGGIWQLGSKGHLHIRMWCHFKACAEPQKHLCAGHENGVANVESHPVDLCHITIIKPRHTWQEQGRQGHQDRWMHRCWQTFEPDLAEEVGWEICPEIKPLSSVQFICCYWAQLGLMSIHFWEKEPGRPQPP